MTPAPTSPLVIAPSSIQAPAQAKKTSLNENIETENRLTIDEGREEEDALLNSDDRSVLTDVSNDVNTADLLNETNK